MLETIKSQWAARVTVAIFLFFTIWWIILQFMNLPPESEHNQLWGALYGLIALWGGIWGVLIAQKWGGFRSIIGRSILLFALGLLFQEIGQISYAYYISFLHQPIPYPSIGDLFFYATIVLYIAAVTYMAKAAGVHISLNSLTGKLQAIAIPVGILLFSYFFFLREYVFDFSQPLTIFLDLGVPLGQAIYISLAILTFTLSKGTLGGVMKNKVLFILFALLAQYLADWTFLYQASQETWYTGGINDYMFLVSYFLMSFGLIQLLTIFKKLKQ